MDGRLTDALSRHPQIHDWTARRQRGHSVQIYLVGGAVENVRHVEREAYEVEIFNDHQAAGTPSRGSATLPLSRGDLEQLDSLLDDGALMASLVHNPPWSLPDDGELPNVELADPALATPDAALQAARDTAEQIRELVAPQQERGVRLSSAELYFHLVEEELENSRGLRATATGTRVMFELTLLARGADAESEYFATGEVRRLGDLELDRTIRDGAQLARDKLRAEMPATRTGPVVVSDNALAQMLGGTAVNSTGALLTQASASTAYSKLSRLEVGSPIHGDGEVAGDLITLRSNARLPFGVASYRFDADGVGAQDVLVVQDGILRARPASQRYGQYLQLPVTGRPGMMDLARGSMSMDELLDGDEAVCHVLAFSAPNVDVITGDFGMEIRIGYERGPAGSRPLSGASVTGNLFDALGDVRLSSEARQFGTALAPAAMRFGKLQITGRD
jgi:predicted Zn-dependent protease